MRGYISGAIASDTGQTPEEKREAFHRMERLMVNSHGLEAVNPLNVPACSPLPEGACGEPVKPEDPESHSWQCYMRYDIIAMMGCDFVVALSGWQRSRGATVEVELARSLGIPVYDERHQTWLGEVYPKQNPWMFAGSKVEGS